MYTGKSPCLRRVEGAGNACDRALPASRGSLSLEGITSKMSLFQRTPLDFFSLVSIAEYKILCPGGEGFRPNPITVILEGISFSFTHREAHAGSTPGWEDGAEMLLFPRWQILMSARSSRGSAKAGSASTPLAASSAGAPRATT